MVVIECSVPQCEFTTGNVSETLAIALITNHNLAHTPATSSNQPPPAQASRGPKLDRPKINVGVTVEEWNVFQRRWEVFKTGSGIPTASASAQLFQCAEKELGDSILKNDPHATSKALTDLLEDMRSLAVIPVATCVLRTDLLQLRQERDEPFRAFAAKVRGKAETCTYSTPCTCGLSVDYTDAIIRDVILNGLYDDDIRREVLGTTKILEKPINEVIALVESKEMARNALPSPSISALSSLQQQRKLPATTVPAPSPADRAKEATCPDCRHTFRVFTEGARGWNEKPHQLCIDCYRANRRRKRQQQSRQRPPQTPQHAVQAMESEPISQIAALHAETTSMSRNRRTAKKGTHATIKTPLEHHIFSKGEWRRARLRDHPRAPVTITLAHPRRGSNETNSHTPQAEVTAIADTGAQSDLWSLSEFLSCGFSRDELQPIRLSLSAANRSPIAIEGAFFAKLTTKSSSGKATSCHSMVYVSSSVRDMYLSYESLLNLGLLPCTFPSSSDSVATTYTEDRSTGAMHATRVINEGCPASSAADDSPCSCPQRTATPQRPAELPFPCTPENNERMKAWLLDRYAASTFNTCPHRALPCMEGPPVEIHVDPAATPRACHTPANIPLHWQQRVYDDLLRDEALGVIERVPYGEPVTWCHRMVITRKHDGSPRRTVDLSPLNKFCLRETFAMESPFHLARRVPKDTWKTVTDAWNGYHSVPLRESDRHLTSFITPFGRWRYTRAPQGFLSSGDGYNRRFDAVLAEFERKERCVDDTIHYDSDLQEHWWRTIDFLTRVGQAGIVLNPDKFQFAEQNVDFAGFRISDTTIEPLPKYLDTIRDFPSPTSTTDVRSWFGLVNQVSNYAQLRDLMAPFKPFLSPRCQFSWSPTLEDAFQASKEAIVAAIRQGVEIFDPKRRTCLRPDWSKQGIGYFLLQQHCNCPSGVPDCCPDGWKITLAGSRFLSPAEQRYAAIEGEALAVAWGLEQTRYFTQGCDDLIIVTDHKPLTKIFGDRTLDEITNTRLFRLKQRTLSWRFKITHLPGKSNHAADAASRHPSPSCSGFSSSQAPQSLSDDAESAVMAMIRRSTEEVGMISWSHIAQATAADASMSIILQQLEQGTTNLDSPNPDLGGLRTILDSLYAEEGVLLYQDRVVIPPSLRQQVLKHLHAAHQGTSTMEQRARAIVYWPGMTQDIREERARCADCNRNAPSQAATPPIPSPPPSTPFEAVFADFFDFIGRHYLVVGDRLSGWVEVLSSPAGTNLAGSAGLIRHLRSFFATFGVPEELSSDGGPEFTSTSTEEFLRIWGIRHRLSSVSFPQSNGRAEVAVKTAKRLLMSNTGPTGSLDHDCFLRAMLQLRNTPDADCNLSPAQIIFGRPLRDTLSFVNRLEKFSNPNIRPLWREAWQAKEDALRTRLTRTTEALQAHSRPLRPLSVGERVLLQNQQGSHPNKWDRSGVIVDSLGHDQYRVKVDGSGRLTIRNRRFLRAYTPASPSIPAKAPVPPKTTFCPERGTTGMYPVVVHQQPNGQVPAPLTRPDGHTDVPGQAEPSTTGSSLDHSSAADGGEEGINLSPDVPADAPPQLAPHTTPTRPRRQAQPPKRYEPETGTWIR